MKKIILTFSLILTFNQTLAESVECDHYIVGSDTPDKIVIKEDTLISYANAEEIFRFDCLGPESIPKDVGLIKLLGNRDASKFTILATCGLGADPEDPKKVIQLVSSSKRMAILFSAPALGIEPPHTVSNGFTIYDHASCRSKK